MCKIIRTKKKKNEKLILFVCSITKLLKFAILKSFPIKSAKPKIFYNKTHTQKIIVCGIKNCFRSVSPKKIFFF